MNWRWRNQLSTEAGSARTKIQDTASTRNSARKNPVMGESTIAAAVLLRPPHTTALVPALVMPAPTSPPINACELLDGMPAHHVIRFHEIAPISAPKITRASTIDASTMPVPTVCATCSPKNRNAMKLKNAAQITAYRGRSTRVDTMVAIEFAASCSPLRKSKTSAVAINPIRTGRVNARSIDRRPLEMIDDERVDLVRHILETIDDFLEVIVDLGADREVHFTRRVCTVGEEQRLAPIVVQLVRALFHAHDLLGDQIELASIVADVAQERHRTLHQLGGGERVFAHLLHLTLEALHLEQRDGLSGLVHLVDGVVERADQVLDICAIKRRDERAPHRQQNLPRDLVGLILERENFRPAAFDRFAAFQEAAQCLRARDHERRMLLKEVKELVLLGHDRLEPAEHDRLAPRESWRQPNASRLRESGRQVPGRACNGGFTSS